jgi:hypothetical protein
MRSLIRDLDPTGSRDRADQRAQPEADAEQVEQRLEEAGQQHQPAVLVDIQVALDEPQ